MKRAAAALSIERITFKGHWATIDCTVLNLSDLGACLKVESPIGIPDTLDLVLDHAPVRGCRVTWRSATQIGVAFVGDFPGLRIFPTPRPVLTAPAARRAWPRSSCDQTRIAAGRLGIARVEIGTSNAPQYQA
jgi:hypothetical protein